MNILGVVILTIIGFGCGVAILLANKYLPKESEHFKKAEEIASLLPGMNCGACGYAGCFAYAQSLSKDKNVIVETPCMTILKNEEALAQLEKKLDLKLSSADMDKTAIIHCDGSSDVVYNYKGILTCKAAAQMAGGYKKCPFGCLGLGDCVLICPNNAISIDVGKNIAIVDHKKCIGCGLCTKECPHNLIEIVSAKLPQYLGCSYTPKFDVIGRGKCSVGCIHCKLCQKAAPNALDWDEKRDLPRFEEKSIPAPEAIMKCPKHIILPLALEIKKEIVVEKKPEIDA